MANKPDLTVVRPWIQVLKCMAGLALAWWVGMALAQVELAVPALTAHVMDTSATLNATQVQALDGKLADFEKTHGTQIVLLLVPTTLPEDIASYANRVANTWKIGRKEIGDGLLVIVAKNDRKVRIEVAKTLEGAIPDLAAKQVIDQAITPRFKQGDFAGGLEAGADQLIALIKGEALPTPAASTAKSEQGFEWMDLFIFGFIAVPVVGALARRIFGPNLGALMTGGAVGGIAFVITSSLVVAGLAALVALMYTLFASFSPGSSVRGSHGPGGWGTGSGGGFGHGGNGGGGFSSGGGGDFGGGGASGDW